MKRLLLAVLLLLPVPVSAGSVTLAWNPNPESGVTYRLGWGLASGTYTGSLDVGGQTTAIVPNLTDGTRYYFVVFAFIGSAVSPPSSEVSAVVAAVPQPGGPCIGAPLTDTTGAVWTCDSSGRTLRNGVWAGGGIAHPTLGEYLLVDGWVWVIGTGSYWHRWESDHWGLMQLARPVPATTTPVNCVVSAWSAWSAWTPINATTEQRTRTRTVLTPPANGGTACPALTETETRPIAVPPPVDVCLADPLRITRIAWPSTNTGRRSITFDVGTKRWASETLDWRADGHHRLTVTDTRGCVAVEVKP